MKRFGLVLLVLVFAVSGLGEPVFAKKHRKLKFNPEQLADKIVVGLVSEEEFLEMELSDEQKLEVFKRIKEKRGWQISDEELATVLNEKSETIMAMGSCNQKVEMENGSYEAVYPSRWVSPFDGECGTDKTDIVLEYNTYWGSRVDPNRVRWWHPLWYDRWVIGVCYNWRGGLSANGLCSRTTRVCIGACANYLGNELNYLYLWHTR